MQGDMVDAGRQVIHASRKSLERRPVLGPRHRQRFVQMLDIGLIDRRSHRDIVRFMPVQKMPVELAIGLALPVLAPGMGKTVAQRVDDQPALPDRVMRPDRAA